MSEDSNRPEPSADPDGDAGLPEAEIVDVVNALDAGKSRDIRDFHVFANQVVIDFLHARKDEPKNNLSMEISSPFEVKPGKERELLQQISEYGQKKNAREKICMDAIVWGHFMQMEMQQLQSSAHQNQVAKLESNQESVAEGVVPKPSIIEMAATNTFDRVFQAGDIARIGVPLKRFLEEYWAVDAKALDKWFINKSRDIKQNKSLPVMGGIRDPRCKFVDDVDQNRPAVPGGSFTIG